MTKHDPRPFYEQELESLTGRLSHLQSIKNRLTWARLLSFIAAIAGSWSLLSFGWIIALFALLLLLSVFAFFVWKDIANNDRMDETQLRLQINRDEISMLDHHFTRFPGGDALQPEDHAYADDLDIFGRASLYQYINRTQSEQGNRLLADWLLAPSPVEEVKKRQDTVRELAADTGWRQHLQALGMRTKVTLATQAHIRNWLDEKNSFTGKSSWKIARVAFPVTSFLVLAMYITGIIHDQQFLLLVLLMLAYSFSVTRKIMPAYAKLNKITGELDTLSAGISQVEKAGFRSPLFIALQLKTGSVGNSASRSIRQLKKILDRMDYRLNPVVFIPLSAFFCWDLQQVFALEKWKSAHRKQVDHWFEVIAAAEALSSLGTLAFNHPDWCFPKLAQENTTLRATHMGHPLIPPASRVSNQFENPAKGRISLVTGSNMAGKSTFLRTVGVNIVLAMTGAPVCASDMELPPVKVLSSMRVKDNLEESTSTFYAELKKLKTVIDALNRKEPVFLLLDEILRGTNSADRYKGSAAMLRQLVRKEAAGILATHDLALTALANEYPGVIVNYHFDVQVSGEELYFDYKLKERICRSMNASLLMKKIGIEL